MLPLRPSRCVFNAILLSRQLHHSWLIPCQARVVANVNTISSNEFHILTPTPSSTIDYPPESITSPLLISKRYLAKNRDKVKERKTDKPKRMLDDDEMERVMAFEDFKQEVELIIDEMKNDLKLNYNIRLNPRQIELLEIHYDGMKVALADLVTINRKGQDLVLNFSATPEAAKSAITALHESGLNLGLQQDGHYIIIRMPKVTTEHRQALIKNVRALGEKTKNKIKDSNYHKRFMVKDSELKKVSTDLVRDAKENLNYYINQKRMQIGEIIAQKCDSLENN